MSCGTLPPPEGRNYGVYATATDTLVLLDIDDYDEETDTSGLGGLADLPPTFEVESPHGGTHRYYAVEPTEEGLLPAAVLKKTFGSKNPDPTWGEVRVANQYVVGPGSQLDGCEKDRCDACRDPDGSTYIVRADRSIATVAAADLVTALEHDPSLTSDSGHGEADERSADSAPVPDDVEARLEYALKADDKLRRLWNTVGHGSDDRSRDEAALAAKLGWWFGNDKATVRELMDRSGAAKWAERPDDNYRDSILKAVEVNTDHYEPGKRPNTPATSTANAELKAAAAEADGGVAVEERGSETALPQTDAREATREQIRRHVVVPFDPPRTTTGSRSTSGQLSTGRPTSTRRRSRGSAPARTLEGGARPSTTTSPRRGSTNRMARPRSSG